MNPNQNLIDYQNQLFQKNLDAISVVEAQKLSLQGQITYAEDSIESFNNQITDCDNQIDQLNAGNLLITDTIAILSA